MFDACCCIEVGDDAPDVFSQTEPRARKEYVCGECDAKILPGQRYRRETGKWKDSWNTHITCIACAAMRDDRMSCGYFYGQIWNDLAECLRGPCDDMSWLHPMFDGTGDDCECEECWPEGHSPPEESNG